MRRFKSVLAAAALMGLAACTDPATATRVAENHGFTRVEITGYRFFGCSEHDVYHTGFRATAPNGRRVEGVVCSGFSIFGKSNTLRLD